VYKHADQHAHKYACVNTCRYIKPDVDVVITVSFQNGYIRLLHYDLSR
jgi:hypothetical protein